MIQKSVKLSFILSHFVCAEPLVQGYTTIKPLSIVCLCRTRLAVSAVLTTCLGALAGEAALLWGCQGSRTVFRAGGTLNVFPLMR